MDWSSVYDNTGEEEGQWEDHGETRSSRVAHRLIHRRKLSLSVGGSDLEDGDYGRQHPHQQQYQHHHAQTVAAAGPDVSPPPKYSALVAYAFTVNYILGVGSLGIPYAYYRAGLVMGNALILLVTLMSYWTVMWVSETMARARQSSQQRVTLSATETSALTKNSSKRSPPSSTHGAEFDDFPEVTWLCDRFLGRLGSRLYQLALLGLMYGGLLGYSQVFVTSFLSQVDHVSGMTVTSGHAALVFAVIVVPLSCADLTEQIVVQLTMSVVRFAALLIMILSACYAIYADPYDTDNYEPESESDAHALMDLSMHATSGYVSPYALVNWGGFGVMFSTAVFSQLFQHSVPGLLAPLGVKNQTQAPAIFGSTLLTTMCFYIALGSICSLYFGAKTAPSVNLNWASFTWGIAETVAVTPWWAKLMSTIVVIFPALDTLSVYPLISVTLGDNMAAIVPPTWVAAVGGRSFWKMVCRLLACVPPLLVSVFVSDLSLTLQFSGMAGVYVAFFAPAMLQLSASSEFPDRNVYSGRFSGPRFAYAVLVFGVFAFGVLLYQLALQVTS